METLLPTSFYARDALHVAYDLLGAELRYGGVRLRITEVEAYRHPGDTANHCRSGRTARNAPMWGPPGHAYVFLCYGIHSLLNFVTNEEGEGAAVLIRACEPVDGLELVRARRGGARGVALTTGPGRVTRALGIDTRHSGAPLFVPGGLEVHRGAPACSVLAGPRIGIDYADAKDRSAPYRLAVGESDYVLRKSELKPVRARASSRFRPRSEPRRTSDRPLAPPARRRTSGD
jgi:DNA-3-methyladenine glycosylase